MTIFPDGQIEVPFPLVICVEPLVVLFPVVLFVAVAVPVTVTVPVKFCDAILNP